MYKIFCHEKLRLQKIEDILSPEQLNYRYVDCYAMAKRVIEELSRNVLTNKDKEASHMLDMAMRAVIDNTNELNELQVCYLCRNYSNLSLQQNFGNEDGLSDSMQQLHVDEKETEFVHKKLARSHFFPRSILKRFSSGHPLPQSRRAFHSLYPTGKDDGNLIKSAKQVALHMLCHDCEHLISRSGEEQFPSLFFDRIYDIHNPLSSRARLDIEYGDWLYQFCIGMIFRNLILPTNCYLNEDEVYNLLVQCRNCLLNIDAIEAIPDKPEVFILISSLHASSEELQHGHMNSVLTNTCAACLRDISLESGTPSQMSVHFFVIHMGVINILVKFSPARDVDISPEFRVDPAGGVYHVPSEEDRLQFLPKGLWKLFQLIAQDYEIRIRQYPVQLDEWLQNRGNVFHPNESTKEVFGIMEGTSTDYTIYPKGGVEAAPSTHAPKVLNLLPSDFKVKPKFLPSAVLLPEGHRILIHYTEWKPEEEFHSVLFLCIGSDAGYSVRSPYIIWHHERPGFICSVGFFISTDDLSATIFLPDKYPKAMLKNKDPISLAPFIKRLPQLLPQMLKLKGFHSIHSLLFRAEMIL